MLPTQINRGWFMGCELCFTFVVDVEVKCGTARLNSDISVLATGLQRYALLDFLFQDKAI